MPVDLINIGLAFIEGFALIIAPCILPILPIILTGSLAGNKFRPLGIIIGFIITFTLVTLFSKFLIDFAHINPEILRNISYIILILLGLIMMSSYLTDKFGLLTQRLANIGSSMQTTNKSGFFGGILFGGLIGIIWTPCVGPILAAVIVQAVTQQTTFGSVLIVLSFAIGVGVPMFLIAFFGRKIMSKFRFFRDKTKLFRKILGALIILGVIFSIYSTNITLLSAQTSHNTQLTGSSLMDGLSNSYPTPNIEGIDTWINSPPLQIKDLKDKVILIDFWTYSCINCIRTLPYLKDWYAKYHDKGFIIIGIHSPEFQFEHDLNNVKNAVEKYGIHYPVALDNHFITWRNFHNQYWPAHFLIDKKGYVVYEHFGEGEYDVTENNIRYLLGLTGPMTSKNPEPSSYLKQTPETYLGYNRAENFASPESITKNQPLIYSYPKVLATDKWALQGKWIIYPDKIMSADSNASIKLHFYAGKVYAVMGTTGKPVTLRLKQNGKLITDNKETDVVNGQVAVNGNRLYTLINLKQPSDGTIELTTATPGLELYTFTFGN
jgi:cytochrome c biogenesis protein CcdA/thiol-disulfide isomerase/thioredoxin